jgi:membrane protein implicated in regulation of membrane protease activity
MTRKTTRNYWLVVAQALLALLLGVSSLLLWVVFPRGYFPGRILWVNIHKWSGLALGVLVFFHAVLHWRWLIRTTQRHFISLQNMGRRSIEHLSDLTRRRRPGICGGRYGRNL